MFLDFFSFQRKMNEQGSSLSQGNGGREQLNKTVITYKFILQSFSYIIVLQLTNSLIEAFVSLYSLFLSCSTHLKLVSPLLPFLKLTHWKSN